MVNGGDFVSEDGLTVPWIFNSEKLMKQLIILKITR